MRRPRVTLPDPPLAVVLVAAAVAAGVRLLLLTVPLSPDEAGFLLVAQQWHPGRSLYGDYWVDRPPGLIALFGLAQGPTGLRLLGVAAAVASVLLAAATARVVVPRDGRRHRWVPAATAVLVAALVSSRLLDVTLVNGEVLALPFLLGGVLAALRSAFATAWASRLGWAVLAGASGAAALAVKQNLADVAVVLGCLVLALVVRRRAGAAALLALGGLLGATVVGAAVLGLAWAHGTTPAALWDAVVLFRLRAADVLATPTPAAAGRARQLGVALLLTGAPLVLLRLPDLVRRPGSARTLAPGDPLVGWTAVALMVWEVVSVAVGGSFWLHYLVGLVPGLALVLALTADARHRVPQVRTWMVVGTAVASSVLGLGSVLGDPPGRPAAEVAVARYLREHAHLGTTAVVTFGRPSILREAGMRSPYPLIWSLPMRVRDPGLHELTPLLRRREVQWVLVDPVAMQAWGLTDTRAERVLARNYRPAYRSGDLVVWRAVRHGAPWHTSTV